MEKKRSIGGIWKRTTKKGDILLSISLEIDGKKLDLVGFKNNFKTEAKHPDYSIFVSEPYTPQSQNAQAAKPVKAVEAAVSEDDDLPF